MGAWGHGPFDNDDAADWLADLEESSDLGFLRSSLQPRWFDYLYLQAPKGSVIIAAAEVLAAGLGRAAPHLPVDAKYWVRLNSRLNYKSLVGVARIGIQRVMGARSELRALWRDGKTDVSKQWTQQIEDLARRVGG